MFVSVSILWLYTDNGIITFVIIKCKKHLNANYSQFYQLM